MQSILNNVHMLQTYWKCACIFIKISFVIWTKLRLFHTLNFETFACSGCYRIFKLSTHIIAILKYAPVFFEQEKVVSERKKVKKKKQRKKKNKKKKPAFSKFYEVWLE